MNGRVQRLPMAEQFENLAQALQSLSPQEAFVRKETDAPVNIRTLRITSDCDRDSKQLNRVMSEYRSRFQRIRADTTGMESDEASGMGERARRPTRALFTTPDSMPAS